MSEQVPPGSPGPMGQPGPVDYQGVTATQGMAVTSMVLGIAGVVLTCLLIGPLLGIAAIVLGAIAMAKAKRDPMRFGGKGFALAGVITGAASFLILALMLLALVPGLGRSRELANRSHCAANLRGIANSMVIYAAQNNDDYPVLPYAPYSPTTAEPSTVTGGATADLAIASEYQTGSMNGSVLAAQWLLSLEGMSPKLFLCKSDPHAGMPANMTNGAGDWYLSVQASNQISYSFAYPYGRAENEKMVVGPWWKNTANSSLPIGADMAPLNGTGKPTRNVVLSGMNFKAANSGNHQADGENVVYADVHVDYTYRPDVGMGSNNIYALGDSGAGGTQPGKTVIVMPITGEPYDTYMVPARNLDTGGL